MKRLNWLLVIPVIFGLALFTGCEDPLGTDDAITITPGNNADSVEVGVAETFTFSVIADAKIQSIEVLRDNRAVSGTLKEDGFTNNTSDNYTFTYTADESEAGTSIDFSLMVVDNKDNEVFEDFTIYVKDLAPTISEFTAVLMGAQENADYGSFLSATDGTVYKVASAKTNQASVDIIYFYGATNKATLAAPDDAGAADFSVFGLSSWTTKNQTRFTGSLTTDFAAIESADDIAGIVGSPTATKSNDLSQNNVIGFVTQGGKKGVAKVSSLSTGSTGTITIEVKVQL